MSEGKSEGKPEKPTLNVPTRFQVKSHIPKDNGLDFHRPGEVKGPHEFPGADIGHLIRSGALVPIGEKLSTVLLGTDPSKEEFVAEISRLQSVLETAENRIELLESQKPAERSKPAEALVKGTAEELTARVTALQVAVGALTKERDALRERNDQYAARLTAAETDAAGGTLEAVGIDSDGSTKPAAQIEYPAAVATAVAVELPETKAPPLGATVIRTLNPLPKV